MKVMMSRGVRTPSHKMHYGGPHRHVPPQSRSGDGRKRGKERGVGEKRRGEREEKLLLTFVEEG